MSVQIDNLNLSIPAADSVSDEALQQQTVLIENFILLQEYVQELEARIAALEALHP